MFKAYARVTMTEAMWRFALERTHDHFAHGHTFDDHPPQKDGARKTRHHTRALLGFLHSTKGRPMVKAVVLYGPPEDPRAFERYYADTHAALAKAIPGLQRFEAAQGIATPDRSAVPYQRIAELTFEDMDALQAGLGSDEGRAAVNDIPNFATGGVTIFFAEID